MASPDDCIERDEYGNPAREDVASVACRSPAECGGYPCAANFFMGGGSVYGCFSRWAVGDMGWAGLCRTVADCTDFGHKHPAGCTPADTFPPGTDSCGEYRGDPRLEPPAAGCGSTRAFASARMAYSLPTP